MALVFDATLKDLLAPNPEDLVPIFGLPEATPAVVLNVDLSTISAATDVAIGFGAPIQEIVDLNFQSGADPNLVARCHLYNAALHLRYSVPVRTLIVLLRPKADSLQITGKMAYASGASGIEFRYEIVRMWEQSAERFLKAGVHLLPLATLCQLPPEKPASEAITQVVREIDRRLVEECDHAQGVRLMTAAFVLAGLRVKRDELSSVFHGVSIMHQESTAFDYYAEQGAIKLARRLLNRQGQKRFGKPDDKSLAALEEIEDLDRLERLSDAILTVASWEELLATP